MFVRVRVLFLVVFSFAVASSCHGADYRFVAIENLFEQKVGALVIPKVYAKLGLSVSIEPMPGKRAIAEATSGRLQGEIMRIWTYGEEHPEVIRVPTPYYQLETRVFYKEGADVVVHRREDLRNYEVLKVRGVKHTNNITQGMEKVYDYDNTSGILRALRSNNNTLAITHTADGVYTARKLGLEGIRMVEEPLARLKLYHYIHRDQQHLVEKVDKVLRDMKASGELAQVIAEAEKKVAESY